MDFAGIWAGSFCGSSFPERPFVLMDDSRGGGFTGVRSQKGTRPRMITLGINYSQMHDSSACIVRDGELLFAVAEERISRLKHDSRVPQLAIQACLEFAQARTGQVDEVCFGWQTAGPVYRHDLKLYALGKWPITYLNLLNSTRHFASMWHQESGARRFMQHFGHTKARMRFV